MSPRLISGGRKVVTELSSVVGDAMDNGWIPGGDPAVTRAEILVLLRNSPKSCLTTRNEPEAPHNRPKLLEVFNERRAS